MDKDPVAIWQECIKIIRQEVNASGFKTWFEPIKPVKLEKEILTIQVPN